jgi:hydroxyacylglutathione hydrolase
MTTSAHQALSVLIVPAFKDNYLWLIHDGVHAVAVDPGDGKVILAALAEHRLTLSGILLTHHHADHIGGVPDLLAHASVPVFGPRGEDIACVTVPLGEGDLVDLPGLPMQCRVLDVPGHTRGHIAYFYQPAGGATPWLFCGDTLFAGGCGRLFEGTPAQMVASLAKLAALPDDTLVYCAHEYTLANLRFALAAEPGNARLQQRLVDDSARREAGLPTVPSTIAIEKASNPFLRYREPGVLSSLRVAGKLSAGATPVEAFAALRLWKNTF